MGIAMKFPHVQLPKPFYGKCGVCDCQRKLVYQCTITGINFCVECKPAMQDARLALDKEVEAGRLIHPPP